MSSTTLDFGERQTRQFYALALLGGLVTLAGLAAAHYMEERGHIVTGMTNQVVWGLPHVFAIFMIVAASGVLNVASIGSVFRDPAYKPRAPLSALLCAALLAGGLMVLMLDLGRPERVIVAATHYNFKSVFAWNVFIYSGMFAIVVLYLWTLLERRMNRFTSAAGILALVWRFVLTTGTGSIFAFLVARQAYQSALLAPLFIVLSFAWGLAVFLVVQSAMYAWNGRRLHDEVHGRMARLLGLFVAAALYLVVVYHLTNLYYARQSAFEAFILLGRGDGGPVFAWLFWGGYVILGAVLPLALLLRPGGAGAPRWPPVRW
jgi:molybdopterin-containing oxidoreductase family membrane subunit